MFTAEKSLYKSKVQYRTLGYAEVSRAEIYPSQLRRGTNTGQQFGGGVNAWGCRSSTCCVEWGDLLHARPIWGRLLDVLCSRGTVRKVHLALVNDQCLLFTARTPGNGGRLRRYSFRVMESWDELE